MKMLLSILSPLLFAITGCSCDARYMSHEPVDATSADAHTDAQPCGDQ